MIFMNTMIPERYIHNLSVYTEEDFALIRKSRITVVSAGGLGGAVGSLIPIAASIQVAEGLKYLLGQHNPEKRILLYFDLQPFQITKIDLGNEQS